MYYELGSGDSLESCIIFEEIRSPSERSHCLCFGKFFANICLLGVFFYNVNSWNAQKNGVPAYGPMESDSVNAVEPPENVSKGAEFWYGHVGGNTGWHVHAPGMSIKNSTELVETDHIGWSLDGFPIFGPVDDPESVLDECNGRTVNGNYQYHVRTHSQVDNNKDYCVDEANGSPVNQWNYILGCYSGSLSFTHLSDSSDYILDNDCVLEGTDTTAPTSSPIDSGNRPNIIIMQPDDLEFFDE